MDFYLCTLALQIQVSLSVRVLTFMLPVTYTSDFLSTMQAAKRWTDIYTHRMPLCTFS